MKKDEVVEIAETKAGLINHDHSRSQIIKELPMTTSDLKTKQKMTKEERYAVEHREMEEIKLALK